MAAHSKAQICGRSPAEILGSNPTDSMDVCLLWVMYVVRQRSLRRADPSSRGVLPTVVRRRMWSRNLVNEEAMAYWGLLRQKQTNTQRHTNKNTHTNKQTQTDKQTQQTNKQIQTDKQTNKHTNKQTLCRHAVISLSKRLWSCQKK